MGLDQYNCLGEHYGPRTASSVFLILLLKRITDVNKYRWTALTKNMDE